MNGEVAEGEGAALFDAAAGHGVLPGFESRPGDAPPVPGPRNGHEFSLERRWRARKRCQRKGIAATPAPAGWGRTFFRARNASEMIDGMGSPGGRAIILVVER